MGTVTSQSGLKDLGEGLFLRRATVADTETLVTFHADMHRDPGVEEPDEWIGAWVRDLMTKAHPTFDLDDFLVVEDGETGEIVSSVALISQTWSYGGIEFGVGRPELVATHPDYRRRGLVRAQFEMIHQRSAERGEMMQAITGIPWYYRQFGYEMGLCLGGRRAGYGAQVPTLKEGEEELYRFRPARAGEWPILAQAYEYGTKRSLVACVRDEAQWLNELEGKHRINVNRRELRVIEDQRGDPVGMLAHSARLWRNGIAASRYELLPGHSWLAVTPAVIGYLWSTGETWAAADEGQEMEVFRLNLGAEHPAYEACQDRLPATHPAYAWYVRVPDLPGFLRHVAPVLERRLAGSLAVGYGGQLKVSFYRDGLRLVFADGRLKEIAPWQPTTEEEGDAAFPDLTFLQLLFGYRSLDELAEARADCWAANDAARVVLDSVFPKQISDVWPLS